MPDAPALLRGLRIVFSGKAPCDAWHGIQPWLYNCSVLLTEEENPVKGFKADWDIKRGLQVLGGHTMCLTPEGEHRVTLKTTRTDTHPINPQPGVLQGQACCLHTKEAQK